MTISNLRIKIAKWLAPEVFAERDDWENISNDRLRALVHIIERQANYHFALRDIASLRTPKCAYGVKKACDIAEAALAHREGDSA